MNIYNFCCNRESLEEVESYYRQKEDRLRTAHADHVEELENRISTLQSRLKVQAETFEQELEQEKDKRKAELKSQAEEHAEMVQMIKTEYTLTLDRIREMQDEGFKAEEAAGNASK